MTSIKSLLPKFRGVFYANIQTDSMNEVEVCDHRLRKENSGNQNCLLWASNEWKDDHYQVALQRAEHERRINFHREQCWENDVYGLRYRSFSDGR